MDRERFWSVEGLAKRKNGVIMRRNSKRIFTERGNKMARNAPTVDGSAPFVRVSFKMIDRSGDKTSVPIEFPSDVTDAQIEAAAVALGVASNALLYEIEVQYVYSAPARADLAVDAVHDSVFDSVVLLFKDVANRRSQNVRIPAPINAITAEADRIATGNAAYVAFRDAVDTALGGSWDALSARYTERREINSRSTPA